MAGLIENTITTFIQPTAPIAVSTIPSSSTEQVLSSIGKLVDLASEPRLSWSKNSVNDCNNGCLCVPLSDHSSCKSSYTDDNSVNFVHNLSKPTREMSDIHQIDGAVN